MELSDDECPIHHKGKCCDNGECECRHVFVINKAEVKKSKSKHDGKVVNKVIFYVSSEDIDKNNKNPKIIKLKEIPTTKKGHMFHNARFDIDYNMLICDWCKKVECKNNPACIYSSKCSSVCDES